MAFSYSDKNFTVVGNLCFVHIVLDGTKTTFNIPPAISERMLFHNIICSYSYYTKNKARGEGIPNANIGTALISPGTIYCSEAGTGYLSFYFPIDSNK